MIVTKEMGVKIPDTTIDQGDPVFFNVLNEPFHIYGFHSPFIRVPADAAMDTSEPVSVKSKESSGGRVRFKTDSDYIVLHIDYKDYDKWSPLPMAMTLGGDILSRDENGKYMLRGIFAPSQGEGKTYVESRVRVRPIDEKKVHEYILDLPQFCEIENAYIAIREGSILEEAPEYKYTTPIVFYGSSIVHGVGASRPGCTYPAIISRHLDTDYRNIGFGGAARAEKAIIDYIKTIPMSIFVYDYDHNAPSPSYLRETHYKGYLNFREACPNVPVIMASKPDYYNPYVEIEDAQERLQIITESYNRGIAAGDKNLYMIDGRTFYEDDHREDFTFDGCHPNDMGYLAMAKKFEEIIKPILEKE